MAFCSYCGADISGATHFCTKCGAPTEQEQIRISESVEACAQPPVTLVTPPLATKYKVFGFVGMGLGIVSCFTAGLGLIYTLLFCLMPFMGFYMGAIFITSALPFNITGLVMSNISKKAGNTSRACKAGFYTSVASLILTGGTLIVGILNLIGTVLLSVLLSGSSGSFGY